MSTDASDLHLKPGLPAYTRVKVKITPTRSAPLTGRQIEEMVLELMTDAQRATYMAVGQIDLVRRRAYFYESEDVAARMIDSTGPKTSSQAICISAVTWSMTVGPT